MDRTDTQSKHSSIIWSGWLNGYVLVCNLTCLWVRVQLLSIITACLKYLHSNWLIGVQQSSYYTLHIALSHGKTKMDYLIVSQHYLVANGVFKICNLNLCQSILILFYLPKYINFRCVMQQFLHNSLLDIVENSLMLQIFFLCLMF